jgi:antitoxin component of MazEF toxin-antitoxin module
MRVAKWGNSLAVRLHAAVVDALWSEDMQNALVLGGRLASPIRSPPKNATCRTGESQCQVEYAGKWKV